MFDRNRAILEALCKHAAFALLCLIPSLAQNILTKDTQPNRIHGIVVNASTHEAVSHALVFSPDNRFATMTDADGRFEFKLSEIPSSAQNPQQNFPYALNAKKPGYLQSEMVSLAPSEINADITISLVPEARIVGHASPASGELPDKIRVELYNRDVRDGSYRWNQAGTTTTNKNGDFRFANLSAGEYKVVTKELLDTDPAAFAPQATTYGYPPIYYPNATDFASGKTITLSAGMTFQADMTLIRRAYYPVKMPVTNIPSGAGLVVHVFAQGRRGPGFELGYNPQTQMIEGLLPDGVYTVEAFDYGQHPGSGSSTLSVRGGPATGGLLAIMPNGPIAVNVKEEFSGNEDSRRQVRVYSGPRTLRPQKGPRSYLNLYLESADDFDPPRGASLSQSKSDDDSLVLQDVAPGRYWVRINSSRGFPASVTSAGIDLLHETLTVGPAGTNSPIEITMRDETAELDGVVEGLPPNTNFGDPTSGPLVYLISFPNSGGQFHQLWLSSGGTFHADALPPGVYRLLAFDHPKKNFAYRDADFMRTYDSTGIVVHLAPGQKEQVRLQILSASE